MRPLSGAIVNKPTKAIDARITGDFETDYEALQGYLQETGYIVYELAKEMEWWLFE